MFAQGMFPEKFHRLLAEDDARIGKAAGAAGAGAGAGSAAVGAGAGVSAGAGSAGSVAGKPGESKQS